MKEWEYMTFSCTDKALTDAELNVQGQYGWEMCGLNQLGTGIWFLIFKREVL